MWTILDAEGHPRDMGEAQGRPLALQIQEHARAVDGFRRARIPSLRGLTFGSRRGTGVGREMIRHYTHLAERMDGLARGAGVSIDSILALHARDGEGTQVSDPTSCKATALSVMGQNEEVGVTLARSLSEGSMANQGFCIRKSRPAVGFASVEIVLPWMCNSLAGVNQAGLAACIVPAAGQLSQDQADQDGFLDPPPLLLVQECLQRFESVETAQDWAMSRPAWGHATLLLADAEGDRVQVQYEGGQRCDQRALDEPVWIGASALDGELLLGGKPLQDALLSGEADIVQALEVAAGERPVENWVLLQPGRRALEWRGQNSHFRIEI